MYYSGIRRMRNSKEGVLCCLEPTNFSLRRNDPVLDLISAVKGLHRLSSQELPRLIGEAENNVIRCTAENGLRVQIDVERLARHLPLHLIGALVKWRWDEALLEYLLCGFRLLHSLWDLAPRLPKMEQILMEDAKVSEQILDLIFFLLAVLAACGQECHISNHMVHLHSTLVASSLYLLTACVSSQWQELTQLLLQHKKVDIFMDVAFAAVRIDIKFLKTRLSAENADSSTNSSPNAEETLNHLCQQCEASLQFLQSCCQQKLFRERIVRNKELCGKGGVLWLAQAVLDLKVTQFFVDSAVVLAAVSRMKSKVLSILLHLCEVESVSYLDEVASNPGTLNLAKSIAQEVLNLLKKMFGGDFRQPIACATENYPKGQLQLNGMRLADIFSDDSNFRFNITAFFTEVLMTVFSLPHGEFLSNWCSSELQVWEEDATLEYDPFAAAGWTLDLFSSSDHLQPSSLESTFTPGNVPRASYAHQRTSLLVKVIANLHCFVPDICGEDKDLFLHKFFQCLQKEVPKFFHGISAVSDAEKAAIVNRNLSSLLSHAESLIPSFLNEEDVQLLRVFISQLESLIKPAVFEENQVQEAQSRGQLSPLVEAADLPDRSDNLKKDFLQNPPFHEADQSTFRSSSMDQLGDMEKKTDMVKYNRDTEVVGKDAQTFEMDESDLSSIRGKSPINQIVDVEPAKDGGAEVQGEEKMEPVQCEEKHQRKRKRTIMNDKQIALIEKALIDEPDMHRNAALLQSWADKLSDWGSVVTPSQLKNWLNNRKARMARVVRVLSEGDNPDRQGGYGNLRSPDLPSCPLGDVYVPTAVKGNQTSGVGNTLSKACTKESSRISSAAPHELQSESVNLEPGQCVLLLDQNAKEIVKGNGEGVSGAWPLA